MSSIMNWFLRLSVSKLTNRCFFFLQTFRPCKLSIYFPIHFIYLNTFKGVEAYDVYHREKIEALDFSIKLRSTSKHLVKMTPTLLPTTNIC